jgi:hypothetical protein
LLQCLRYWCLSNGFSNITADISPFCAVVAVSKIDILVCDISLMNLMDECTLFACMEETMEIFFSVPPFHVNVVYKSKTGEGWRGEDSRFSSSSLHFMSTSSMILNQERGWWGGF